MRYRQAVPYVLWFLGACSGGSPRSGSAGSGPAEIAPTRSSDVITRSEIDASDGATTALELIQRIRPRFLRDAGTRSMRAAGSAPAVRLDNESPTGIEVLRTLTLNEVQEIRYYNAVDATARFGGFEGRPVIHIVRRAGGR